MQVEVCAKFLSENESKSHFTNVTVRKKVVYTEELLQTRVIQGLKEKQESLENLA